MFLATFVNELHCGRTVNTVGSARPGETILREGSKEEGDTGYL
jgi:hypothetical protein